LADIRLISDWRASTKLGGRYEKLLAAIGTDDFGPLVRDSIRSVTAGVRRVYLFEATHRERSTLQYSDCEPGVARLFPAYRKWYLRVDPVLDALAEAPECGDVAMLRVQPPDIAPADFRKRFFDDGGIVERVSVIQRGADGWRVINVARHVSKGCCSEQELGALVGLACLVLPMLPLNRVRRSAALQPLTVAQLEERFAARFAALTARERQVCARAALGMSVEATALDLGIAKTSVLTYRQRAYQRLRVTSPYELCALVTH
jgi:DNA-binding CsgD family transcriptional regulator